MSGASATVGSAKSQRSLAAWMTAVMAPENARVKKVSAAGAASVRSVMAAASSYCMIDRAFRYSPRSAGELITSRTPAMTSGSGAALAGA